MFHSIFHSKYSLKQILTYLFGFFMMSAGIMHFFYPTAYFGFVPDQLSRRMVVYLSGAIEILLGLMTFSQSYRSIATLGILLLMIGFLPLHFIDIFRHEPCIGSHSLALIRFPIQFLLIYWAWYINKR